MKTATAIMVGVGALAVGGIATGAAVLFGRKKNPPPLTAEVSAPIANAYSTPAPSAPQEANAGEKSSTPEWLTYGLMGLSGVLGVTKAAGVW